MGSESHAGGRDRVRRSGCGDRENTAKGEGKDEY
jgi:hypothetical protein